MTPDPTSLYEKYLLKAQEAFRLRDLGGGIRRLQRDGSTISDAEYAALNARLLRASQPEAPLVRAAAERERQP
jgi:hypothetical protein